MKLLDTAEEQCNELGAKHAQLGKDKRQLKEAIEQLDEKKKRELLAAHKQISSVSINLIAYTHITCIYLRILVQFIPHFCQELMLNLYRQLGQ
jgi:uncharacterized protein YpmS